MPIQTGPYPAGTGNKLIYSLSQQDVDIFNIQLGPRTGRADNMPLRLFRRDFKQGRAGILMFLSFTVQEET